MNDLEEIRRLHKRIQRLTRIFDRLQKRKDRYEKEANDPAATRCERRISRFFALRQLNTERLQELRQKYRPTFTPTAVLAVH
jgi:hypothetical protein